MNSQIPKTPAMPHDSQQSGIILLRKRKGYTSFDEIRTLRNRYKLGKVGHAGTLDKFAEGLLVVLVGYMTKFSQWFMSGRKEYRAVIEFGEETDTLDPEGSIVCRKPVPEFSRIKNELQLFTGSIEQVPPQYSAVHVGGERAYRMANRGEAVQLSARTVTVHELSISSWEKPYLACRIVCSKGTYIRSLARDLGRAADSCAFVSSLERTRSGQFSVKDACTVDNFNASDHLFRPETLLRKLNHAHVFTVTNQFTARILNGQKPEPEWLEDSDAELYHDVMKQNEKNASFRSISTSSSRSVSFPAEGEEENDAKLIAFISQQDVFLAAYSQNSNAEKMRTIYVHSSGADHHADNRI